MNENKEYVNDLFTKVEDDVNLEINNLNLSCMTSKDNKFNLDSDGNLTVKSINVLEGNTLDVQNIFNIVYPIGSIYMSVNEVSPKVLFGGEWEKISGRVLIGEGFPIKNNYDAFGSITVSELNNLFELGKMGGEYSHALTKPENPRHNVVFAQGKGNFVAVYTPGKDGAFSADEIGGNRHNNMPPYLVVSMWKRIA